MQHTVIESLLAMAPQATAIAILMLVAMLGLLLGACAYFLLPDGELARGINVELTAALCAVQRPEGARLSAGLECDAASGFRNGLSREDSDYENDRKRTTKQTHDGAGWCRQSLVCNART